jgi:hypothetical protein
MFSPQKTNDFDHSVGRFLSDKLKRRSTAGGLSHSIYNKECYYLNRMLFVCAFTPVLLWEPSLFEGISGFLAELTQL